MLLFLWSTLSPQCLRDTFSHMFVAQHATSFAPRAVPLVDKSIKGMTGVEAHLHHRSPTQTYTDTCEDVDIDLDPCQSSCARLTFDILITSESLLQGQPEHVYIFCAHVEWVAMFQCSLRCRPDHF